MSLLIGPDAFLDSNGDPASNGYVYFYDTGTTTLKTVYSDPALTVALANPQRLTAAGRLPTLVYAPAGERYTIDAQNSLGSSLPGYPANNLWGSLETVGTSSYTPLWSTSSRTIQAKLSEQVSVKDFGAVGDGVTDDTAAIQLAIDSLTEDRSRYLFFPSGRYLVSSALDITGTGCRGFLGVTGRSPKVLDDEGSQIYSTATTDYILNITTAEFYCEKMVFRYQTEDAYTQIYLARSAADIDAVFSYCTFLDFDVAIHHRGRGLYVNNCEFSSGNTGIKLDFDSTIAAGSAFGAYSDDRFRAIAIRDNRFHSIDTECIQNTGTDAADILGMEIANNICDGGIHNFFRGALRFSTMTGNVVHNINADQQAVRLSVASRDSVISNNVFVGKASSQAAITDLPTHMINCEAACSRINITSNIIAHSEQTGVRFASTAEGCIISANTFFDAGQGDSARTAVSFVGNATECIVQGNHFEQPTGTAVNYFVVFTADRTNCRVEGNTLDWSRHTGDVDNVNITASGAISLSYPTTLIQTGGAAALSLADGYPGQEIFLIMTVDGGDGTLTPTNLFGGTTITFNDVGDSVKLRFENSNWLIEANNGCAVA